MEDTLPAHPQPSTKPHDEEDTLPVHPQSSTKALDKKDTLPAQPQPSTKPPPGEDEDIAVLPAPLPTSENTEKGLCTET